MRVYLIMFIVVLMFSNPLATANSTKNVVCDYNFDLLAHAVYGEARGEDFLGRQAVTHVIRNRMRNCRFSSEEIILRQGFNKRTRKYEYAFEGINAEIKNVKLYHDIKSELVLHLGQDDITDGATYFYSGDKKPYWTSSLQYVKTIGNHHFYR